MKNICIAAFLTAALSISSNAQKRTESRPTDTLARYGTNVLTVQDFLERFELMPWPLKDNKSRIEYTKQEFLRSLVAEKVLALEAQRLGLGEDSATAAMQYSLQRMFTRDEMYKREVIARIRVTDAELRDGLKKYAWDLRVVVYGLVSKKGGDLLLKKMAASRNRQKTFESFRDSLYTPLDTLTVTFGSAARSVEDAAYALAPGALSQPMQAGTSGWMMLQVIDKYTNAKYAKQSLQDQFSAVRTIASRRLEDSLATRTFASLLSPQRAEADPDVFAELADSVLSIMKTDSVNHFVKNLFQFSSDDLERLERNFGPKCGVKFVSIDSGDLTLGMVLNGLKYNQVVFPSLVPGVVQAILNNNIKTVIQHELLAREGVKRNYQQSENVRHDVGVWMDNRRGKLLLKAVSDTVTVADSEVESFYARNAAAFGARVEVRVRELLVDSAAVARDLRRRADAGEDFAALASAHSKRAIWAARGGVSELFPLSAHPALGGYAATADSGVLVGPVKIPEGWSVFMLLERRINDDSIRQSLAALKLNIRKKLLDEKRKRTLSTYIGGLATKYNVSMDTHSLQRTTTTTTSMVTWRTLGFGGRIMAVPMVSLQSDWVREQQPSKIINQ